MIPDDEDDRPGVYSPARATPSTGSVAGTVEPSRRRCEPRPSDTSGWRCGSRPDEEREGDTGAGRIHLRARGEPLSDEDRRRHDEAKSQELEEERRREELLASEPIRLPRFIVGPLVVGALIAVLAILGLFVLAQVTSTLSALAAFPAWAQALGWIALLLLFGALLYSVGRFLLAYRRLKPNQPIVLKALLQLSQRTRLHWLVREKKAQAKEQLVDYLKADPLDSANDHRDLTKHRLFSVEDLRKLEAVRLELLDPNRFASYEEWFREFRDRFQDRLDKAAEARITYFARRVGVGTAATPMR